MLNHGDTAHGPEEGQEEDGGRTFLVIVTKHSVVRGGKSVILI